MDYVKTLEKIIELFICILMLICLETIAVMMDHVFHQIKFAMDFPTVIKKKMKKVGIASTTYWSCFLINYSIIYIFSDCNIIVKSEFYDNTKPPIPSVKIKGKQVIKTQGLSVNVVILDVLSVNQEDSEFEVFFDISFVWVDTNLEYDYLKPVTLIKNNGSNSYDIWTPNIKFYHVTTQDVLQWSLR